MTEIKPIIVFLTSIVSWLIGCPLLPKQYRGGQQTFSEAFYKSNTDLSIHENLCY